MSIRETRAMAAQAPRECELAVVGGGIAGLVAAAQAASRGASVALFEAAGVHGGLVFNVGTLDDYPAPGMLSGSALAQALHDRASALGAAFADLRVARIEPQANGFTLALDSG